MMMDCIHRTRVTVRQKGSLDTCLSPMPVEKRWTTTTTKKASSALTIALFAGQYLLLDTIATLSFTSR